jgi:hypothetical protein
MRDPKKMTVWSIDVFVELVQFRMHVTQKIFLIGHVS